MPYINDPDYNPTHPNREYLHQKFEEDADEDTYALESYDADVMDELLLDRTLYDLYDPIAAANRPDDSLEEAREDSFFDELHRESLPLADDAFNALTEDDRESES